MPSSSRYFATVRRAMVSPCPCSAWAISWSESAAAPSSASTMSLIICFTDTDDTIRRSCEKLRALVQERDVAFILNDRPDLALELGCDGVHLGQQDTPAREARRLLGDDRIVGVTCHNSRHLAMEAAEAGADYVAFGAFHPSATKEPPTIADPEILGWWSEIMTVPCVAIGGITVDNCGPLIEAGADFIAVSAGVWQHPEGPAAAVRAFGTEINRRSGGG